MKTNFFYILFIATLFVACSDDDDNSSLDAQEPTIEVHEPEEGEMFELGSEIHLDINLADDVELASYKIDVHNNFDGHEHRPAAGTEVQEPWSYSQSYEIEPGQQSYHVHEHIEIPADITTGDYHLGITVIDEAGNQNQAFVEIVIGDDSHEHEGHISIADFHLDDVTRGEELHAEANIEAEHGIVEVFVEIHGHGLTPTDDEIAWEFSEAYDNYTGGTTAEFHEHIDVPENAAPGEYHLTLTVTDEDGTSHSEGGNFHVEE